MMKKLILLLLVPFLLTAKDYPFLTGSNDGFDLFKKQVSQEIPDPDNPVAADIVVPSEEIAAGVPFYAAVRLTLDEGWKAYWKNPGESGFAVDVNWVVPPGFEVEELLWPTPKRSVVNNFVVFGFENELILLTRITPPENLQPGEEIEIAADISWLVCSDTTCLPGDSYQVLKLQTLSEVNVDPAKAKVFAEVVENLPKKVAEGISIKEVAPQAVLIDVSQELYDGTPDSVQFFPEDSNGIDLKKEPTLTVDPQGGLFVSIFREDTAQRPDDVKGILVFYDVNEGDRAFEIDLPLSPFAPEPKTPVRPPFKVGEVEEEYSYGMILLFAFIGGMILNLMPCVLPVVSIKVLGFVQMSNQSRKNTFMHGVLFSLGVLISFWVLAGLLLVLKAYGHAVGWGFQLQDPTFVGLLAAVLLIAAIAFFGVIEMGMGLSSRAGQAIEQVRKAESSKLSSFFGGVLATAVATPCSGPFLGMVLGVAVTLPWYSSLMIFTSLGFGMAFPYLLLAANPKWLKFLPKPGPWMDTFKQMMGFLMLLTVVWLLWVFMAQSDSEEMLRLLIALFIISFGCWVYGHFGSPFRKAGVRKAGRVIGLLIVIYGGYQVIIAGRNSALFEPHEKGLVSIEAGWENFSPERADELRSEGKPVFIDFTAKWCLLCQSNLVSINNSVVQGRMKELGVVKMMADWTRSDPVITAELARFGRNSVPLYIYYPPGKDSDPELLPQVLTPDLILEYLQ